MPARVARGASIGCLALALAACAESTPAAKDRVDLPQPEAGLSETPLATASATASASVVRPPPPPPPDDWRMHRRAQCTPQGQCPPYGGPPPEIEIV